MNRSNCFNKEISYIKDENLKKSLILALDMLPDYFFEVPASSTGKYHPAFSLNEGGLVRHTKVAVRIAKELLDNETLGEFYTPNEKDLLMISIILHDGLKSGLVKGEYTAFDHPIQMATFLKNNNDKLNFSENDLEFITSCIKTHMGPWTKDYQGNEVLEKPKTKYQRFVHMCDFLSSKKFLNVNFVNNDIEL